MDPIVASVDEVLDHGLSDLSGSSGDDPARGAHDPDNDHALRFWVKRNSR
jgi:hypothetical protein